MHGVHHATFVLFLCYQWNRAGWVGSFDSISIGAACPAYRRLRSSTGTHTTTLLLNVVRRFYAQNSVITTKRLHGSVCGRSAIRLPATRPLKHAGEAQNPDRLPHFSPFGLFFSRVPSVLPVCPARPRQALRRPRPSACPAVHSTAPIVHGRSLAGSCLSRPRPAPGSRLRITRRVSVLEPAAPCGFGLQNVSFC